MERSSQTRQGPLAPTPVTLTSIHDVKVYYELDPSAVIRAKVQGIITRVDSRGGIVFFKLYDGTDSIQLIANRVDFSDSDWRSIRSIKQSFRIDVDAYVSLSRSGTISLDLRTVPSQITELRLDLLPEGAAESTTRIASQIFLARLRAQATKFFTEQEFVELEPNFISVLWDSTGLRPLRVDYPGFGGPAYLVPSPSPQLIRAMVLTGRQRMFSVSRCFTTTYRDANSSYQSVVLCAKEMGGSLDRMANLAIEAIRAILTDVSTRPTGPSHLRSPWPKSELNWPATSTSAKMTTPQIHVFKDVATDMMLKDRKIQLFRICWPPDFVLAEGATELMEGNLALGSLTLHIERMLFLIRSDKTLRRLWNEGLKNNAHKSAQG